MRAPKSTRIGAYIKFFGCRVWLTNGLRLNNSLHVFANGNKDSFIGATKVLSKNKFFYPDGIFVPKIDMLVRVLTATRNTEEGMVKMMGQRDTSKRSSPMPVDEIQLPYQMRNATG